MIAACLSAAVPLLTGQASVLYTFYPPLLAYWTFYAGAALLIVGSLAWIPSLAPGSPTVVSPVRIGDCPVMKAFVVRSGLAPSTYIEVGAFGAMCVKPTRLVGVAPYLHTLARRCTAELKLRLHFESVQTASS